jgi:hypothetical protein
LAVDKTWNNFKIHFTAAYLQHIKMQGETLGAQAYANADVAQAGDDLSEQALGAVANLATAIDVDRGMVAQLTEANYLLDKYWKIMHWPSRKSRLCSRNSAQTVLEVGTLIGHLAALSRLLLITIAGFVPTKWHIPIQTKLACIPRMDTSVRPPIQTTWEDPKPTWIDF